MRALPLLLLVAACSSSGGSSSSSKSTSAPQPMAENDVFKISAHKIISKSKHIRVWLTLENKTDQAITIGYGDFVLDREGVTYPGALRVPFARVTKQFEMSAKMVKRFPDAIEFLGAPPSGEGTVKLTQYTVNGEAKTCDLALAIPLQTTSWN